MKPRLFQYGFDLFWLCLHTEYATIGFTSCSSCFRLISAPISRAPKDIAVLIMEMILAANAQEVAMDRIVIKCHER